ncbi:phenylacetate--CoA ligase family protein [Candidatus Peregrinibacteria bacterium]|nr:phenylacetate--CoA ligase family protein [Candidatus Peregrinibacteria bacterium]
MRLFRLLCWKILLLISRQNKLFNETVCIRTVSPSKKILDEKIDKIVNFARNHVGNYKTKTTHEIKEEIITRKLLKETSDGALADEYKRNLDIYQIRLDDSPIKNLFRIIFGRDFTFTMTTGGTSGSPLSISKNKNSIIEDAFLFIRGWKFMGYKVGDKVLVLYNSYYDYDLIWINKISCLFGIKLFFFDQLDKETVTKFINVNNKYKPDFIVTFPSYINDVARTIQENKIKIDHYPKGIEVSGETLFKHQRLNAEREFKTKIYDNYGSIEIGVIAHECKYHNGMHIYEDIVKVTSNKSNLIFTRYDSFDMPIINYQIGDLGKVEFNKCKCGIEGLKLTSVDGRVDDYVLIENKRFYPTLFRQIINKSNTKFNNEIIESQIEQKSANEIKINIVCRTHRYINEIKKYIKIEIGKKLPKSAQISVVNMVKLKNVRKFRFIERNN